MRYKISYLLIYLIMRVNSQCYTEPILGTKIGSVQIETDDFELSNIMSSILQLLIIVKRESLEQQGEFIVTRRDSSLCQFVGEGIDPGQEEKHIGELGPSRHSPAINSNRKSH